MANFRGDDRSGGRRDFPRRDFDGNSRPPDRQLYRATCSSCGKDCQVPFRPTGGKPVFCRDCFQKNNGETSPRRFTPRPASSSHFEPRNSERPQSNARLDAMDAKLDKILSLLSAASPARTLSAEAPVKREARKEEPILEDLILMPIDPILPLKKPTTSKKKAPAKVA